MQAPLRQIVANRGEERSIVVNRVREGSGNFGYNAATNTYGELVAQGVIDTEALVVEKPKDAQGRRRTRRPRRRRVLRRLGF